VLDLGQALADGVHQGVDLGPLGGDLTGVGEVLVERQGTLGALAQVGELVEEPDPLLLQRRAQVSEGDVAHENPA
jgi:hypothetical protein